MSNWEGYAVSVNCGEPLGCYQGTILQADGNTITLTKAFRNGFPYPKSQVTLNAADIKELKIIEVRPQPSQQATSTVAVTKNRKSARATVCESLQANHTNNNNNTGLSGGNGSNKSARGVARSKPIDIAPVRNKSSTHQGSGGALAGSTPKRALNVGTAAARRRNEACFGAAASPADEDFDFEGNLALFDKRALATQSRNKPDLLKQTEESKYRHDENVLGGSSAAGAASILVPRGLRAARDCLTDAGQRVPTLSAQARSKAYQLLRKSQTWDASVVLLARGVADVCLRVAGGGRRLDARNAHQRPRAAALVHAAAAPAAAAALAARLLAAHATDAHVLTLGEPRDPAFNAELARARAADVPVHTRLDALPPADIVILALYDPVTDSAPPGVDEALSWAAAARAHVVALEPCPHAWAGAGAARASVTALLPPALPPHLGQLYLVNVAPPPSLFSALGVTYRPPFGAVSAMPLHAPDDD